MLNQWQFHRVCLSKFSPNLLQLWVSVGFRQECPRAIWFDLYICCTDWGQPLPSCSGDGLNYWFDIRYLYAFWWGKDVSEGFGPLHSTINFGNVMDLQCVCKPPTNLLPLLLAKILWFHESPVSARAWIIIHGSSEIKADVKVFMAQESLFHCYRGKAAMFYFCMFKQKFLLCTPEVYQAVEDNKEDGRNLEMHNFLSSNPFGHVLLKSVYIL